MRGTYLEVFLDVDIQVIHLLNSSLITVGKSTLYAAPTILLTLSISIIDTDFAVIDVEIGYSYVTSMGKCNAD